jgi:hypothetical protein
MDPRKIYGKIFTEHAKRMSEIEEKRKESAKKHADMLKLRSKTQRVSYLKLPSPPKTLVVMPPALKLPPPPTHQVIIKPTKDILKNSLSPNTRFLMEEFGDIPKRKSRTSSKSPKPRKGGKTLKKRGKK